MGLLSWRRGDVECLVRIAGKLGGGRRELTEVKLGEGVEYGVFYLFICGLKWSGLRDEGWAWGLSNWIRQSSGLDCFGFGLVFK